MKKDPKIYIDHILESIAAIEEDIGSFTRDDFVMSRQTQDSVIAVLKLLEKQLKICLLN